jgi:ABC-type multidrug transport system permease subunit
MYDKVLALGHGTQVFYGTAQDARLLCQSLTSCRADHTNIVDGLADLLKSSTRRAQVRSSSREFTNDVTSESSQPTVLDMLSEVTTYPSQLEVRTNTNSFVRVAKSRSSLRDFKNGLVSQLRACSTHRGQSLRSHLRAAAVKQFSTLIQALTCGTLMINAPQDSSGFSVKTGALFFSVLFHSLMALSEIPDFFSKRPNILKYRSLGFYHGTAVMFEQTLYDLFSIFIQVTVFCLPFYFLVGLTTTAPAFFTYWVILFSKSMVSSIRPLLEMTKTNHT